MDCFRQIRRAATVVDGVDEAAQLELYSVADRQPMQMDQGRRGTMREAAHRAGPSETVDTSFDSSFRHWCVHLISSGVSYLFIFSDDCQTNLCL